MTIVENAPVLAGFDIGVKDTVVAVVALTKP